MISSAHLAGHGHHSIHEIPPLRAKEMLESHLLWDFTCSSEFISWTSSLLFALQHAIRKAYFRNESDVCICILNTRKLEEVSIYPATVLLKAYGVRGEGKLRHEYYIAEYLAHGRIEDTDSFGVARLEDLLSRGLFALFREMDDEETKKRLYNGVAQLRDKFFAQPSSVTASEVKSLKGFGMLFGGEFALPMAVAFLSLRLRPLRDENFLKRALDGLRGLEIPVDFFGEDYIASGPKFTVRGLHEVAQFMDLMWAIFNEKFEARPQHSHEDALTQQLSNLSLDSGGRVEPSSRAHLANDRDIANDREPACLEELDWDDSSSSDAEYVRFVDDSDTGGDAEEEN
ncbi:hypothetical protein GP486_002071 [Trichoglossum hirsutum]|uniref:DUF7587 domain-containing protein n=1 Tax=Trichoglossum hirsutum TaxID=265104 RepID=A0A9P8RSG8_9PEZI|nr:hypothetical protein GP486_002071 [Trichoglossum hirsutum]